SSSEAPLRPSSFTVSASKPIVRRGAADDAERFSSSLIRIEARERVTSGEVLGGACCRVRDGCAQVVMGQRWKRLLEGFERVAFGQARQDVPEKHARSLEDRLAAADLRITHDV